MSELIDRRALQPLKMTKVRRTLISALPAFEVPQQPSKCFIHEICSKTRQQHEWPMLEAKRSVIGFLNG